MITTDDIMSIEKGNIQEASKTLTRNGSSVHSVAG